MLGAPWRHRNHILFYALPHLWSLHRVRDRVAKKPQGGREGSHADVTRPFMWTEEEGSRAESRLLLCRVIDTHGVVDTLHAGVRN